MAWNGCKGDGKGQWYEDDPDTALSKKMSKVLRHTTKEHGLEIRPDGYVRIRDMLQIERGRMFAGTTEADVVRIVKSNAKQRFSLSEADECGYLLVRANQGHTGSTGAAVEDDSLLEEVLDAAELQRRGEACVHGTYWVCWPAIQEEGLKAMGRNHVHFAPRDPRDKEVISGMRTTSELLIYLDVPKAFARGMKLYRSKNGVLLSRGLDGVIPPDLFTRVVQRWPTKVIWPLREDTPITKRRVPGMPELESSTQPKGYSSQQAARERPATTSKATDNAIDQSTKASRWNKSAANESKACVADSWEEEETEGGAQAEVVRADPVANELRSSMDESAKDESSPKELRKLEKQLKQINATEEKQSRVDELSPDELAKLARRPEVEEQLRKLRSDLKKNGGGAEGGKETKAKIVGTNGKEAVAPKGKAKGKAK